MVEERQGRLQAVDMTQGQEAGQKAMGVGGKLARDESMVLAENGEKAMDGKTETKMDADIVEANIALQRIKNIPISRRKGKDIWPKKSLDQISLGLGNNRQARFGVADALILAIPAIDFISLSHCDGGKKRKASTGRKNKGVLGDTKPINDWGSRRRKGRRNNHRARSRRSGRRRNRRHGKTKEIKKQGERGRNRPD